MKTRIIIPARLKSTRFPNKLIQLINNISLIEHICIRAKKIPCYSVIVATDDIKIKSLVEQHGIDVWFSKKKFLNGTHRIACLCKEYGFNKNDNIINIQGDEFNFSLKGVKDLITKLSSSKSKGIFTLISKSRSKEIFRNPDHVKVLIERIRVQLRKKESNNSIEDNKSLIVHGRLKLDPSQLECEWNGKPLPDKLTTTEFLIVKELAKRPGNIKERAQLMEKKE